MSKITYHPRIPTTRSVLPSQYQRMRRTRDIIVTWGVTIDEFMAAMNAAADSLARVMADD